MPIAIDRVEVKRLLSEVAAQLVEVLPAAGYRDEHLPGAINIPLKELDEETTRRLEASRPVIVYCYDYQWDLSSRAAARLESIGFTKVYDYIAGKADWGSAGLQLEGDDPSEHRAGAHVRTDVPTCSLGERLADIRRRTTEADWDICFVLDDRGIVLGRVGRSALRSQVDLPASEAMTPGPSTIRPSARLEQIVKRMRDQNLLSLPVTTSDGRLVGLLLRADAEQLAGSPG
jgi:rhodanese-related sulfurtransferase/CBS domain-containing protein